MKQTILEQIYKATLNFLAPLSPEETYRTVAQEAVKLVNGESSSVVLEKGGSLVRVYDSAPSLGKKIKIRKNGFTYKAFITRKAFVVNEKELYAAHSNLTITELRLNVFIPLSYKNNSIGVLIVRVFQEESFTSQQLDVLKLFGSLASMAIRKAQLHEENEEAIKTRDLFFSMAAHELRTPITTIYGYAQLLQNKMRGANSSESRWVREMYTESYRLTLLVHDLLEINRIRTGRLNYTWKECSLRDVTERAISNFRINYPNRKIVFEDKLGDISDLIIGDFDRLLQLFLNLLDNAAKFSPAEKEIVVDFKLKGNSFEISVKDRGKGISKKELPKIFEGFYRGSNHQTEGMGLGLYLSRNIIEEHHGLIKVQSALNKGTTVKIKLPRAKI